MKRLIRILVYEGTDDFIQKSLQLRSIKGSFTLMDETGVIKEAIVGDFLEEVAPVTEVPTVV